MSAITISGRYVWQVGLTTTTSFDPDEPGDEIRESAKKITIQADDIIHAAAIAYVLISKYPGVGEVTSIKRTDVV